MKLVYTEGGAIVILKAKQGRNQKGLCFVSGDEEWQKEGVYRVIYCGKSTFVDIRISSKVPAGLIILDHRIFSLLSCKEDVDVDIDAISATIPRCTNIRLSITSTRELDNRTIANAISQQVNDIKDDFDGLILQEGQSIKIERLGINFRVESLNPQDASTKAARIIWNNLEKINLDPVESLEPFNIVCVVEIGAAAQVRDVSDSASENLSRFKTAMNAIRQIAESYTNYGSGAQFQGFAYSDEIIPFTFFDSETGMPTEVSQIDSISTFIGFVEWLEQLIPEHKGRPSNPGEALQIGIGSIADFSSSNSHPTILLFFSSGVHTSGPNPVKIMKDAISSMNFHILCYVLGAKSNFDVMEAIAEIGHGRAIKVVSSENIGALLEDFSDITHGGP
jgi:hypothetical protein